ncbi:MAG TPA: alpha/beta hydrolase [Terriglobales bacterium]|nr:alpha/beta hydrolase [Terriglobales bacterium]
MRIKALSIVVVVSLANLAAFAQGNSAQSNSTTYDADGTAHITRTVPPPAMVSPEARAYLASFATRKPRSQDLAERRKGNDSFRVRAAEEAKKLYPVNVQETTMAGIRTDIITPLVTPDANRDLVLMNLHGGGFIADSGSLVEGIPIANLAKIKVVSVYYRLAPENPFPAAVDDAVVVYKELLKTYKPRNIGIFGTSAGASLTAEVAVKLKQLGLPLPSALGIFSVHPDFSRSSESYTMYTTDGFVGDSGIRNPNVPPDHPYPAPNADRKDPVLSPLLADLHGMPPSLLVTSTRDLLLSDTTLFHRALLAAGDDAQLVVFEALPHAFWYHYELPETKEALGLMAKFFNQKVGH